MSYNRGKNWKKRNSINLLVKRNNLPNIELGMVKTKFKRSLVDKSYDFFSDKMEKVVKNNWVNYGVPFLNNGGKNEDLHQTLDNKIKYNSEMFRIFGSKGKFYHLTSPKNYHKILKEGIKSKDVNRMTSMGNSNKIWTVESESPLIWNQIGYSQLGMGVKNLPIIVLEIDPKGIKSDITSEEINEFTSPLHSVINQNHIEPKYVKTIGYFKTSREHFYSMRNQLGELKSLLYTSEYRMVS